MSSPALAGAWPYRPGMLDHLSIQCADVGATSLFYDRVLAPLGASRVMDFGEVIGYGVQGKPEFGWVRSFLASRTGRLASPHDSRPGIGEVLSTRPSRSVPRCSTRRAFGPSTTRTTTGPLSATPTATTSKPVVTHRSSETVTLDIADIRSSYPALKDGYAYLDGAAGTQVPRASSRRSPALICGARQCGRSLSGERAFRRNPSWLPTSRRGSRGG